MAAIEPMSDRRMIVLVLALLAALSGAVVVVVAALSLQDPFTVTGELGTRVEISRGLIVAIVLGLLLVGGGLGVAAGLVRAQLRGAQR